MHFFSAPLVQRYTLLAVRSIAINTQAPKSRDKVSAKLTCSYATPALALTLLRAGKEKKNTKLRVGYFLL